MRVLEVQWSRTLSLVCAFEEVVLLEDVFWIMKGFHVTWFWILQAYMQVQHDANQV